MSAKKYFICLVLVFIFIINFISFADYKDSAKVIRISGGENHTMILTQNKWPWIYGANGGAYHYAVLGTGSTNSSLTEWLPVRVHDGDMDTASGFLEDINDIDAGWKHSLALDVNGFVWSWGWNSEGQLGNNGFGDYQSTPVQVLSGEMGGGTYLHDIIAISAGRSGTHSLAVDVNSFVYAWGRNNEGQVGNDDAPNDALTPVKVDGGEMETTYLKDIIMISGGVCHSMALEKLDPCDPNLNGRVYTFGYNQWPYYGDTPNYYRDTGYGRLGNGSTAAISETPVRVLKGEQQSSETYLENIIAVSAGWDHSMALEKDDPNDSNLNGRVYTWGSNGAGWGYGPSSVGGRLGNGTTEDSNTPVLVLSGEQDPCETYLRHIVAVSAGEGHCLALDKNGSIFSWGDNYHGQLGNGTNDPCTTPVRVVGRDGEGYLGNIVAISAGYWHNLAVDADGVIWTWGLVASGRLGLGSVVADVKTPYPIGVVYNLTQENFDFGIQTAINNANSSGDILEASRATYFEDVDFLTKTITLKSTDPNSWGVVEDTIIRGLGVSVPVVKFNNNSNSVLAGFTVTNGVDNIYCNASSPLIANCILRDSNDWGAVYCLGGSELTIKNSKIIDNGLKDNLDAVYCYNSDMTVNNCFIEGSGSSGIYCVGTSSMVITNNTIVNNDNYGIYIASALDTTISNCIVWDNANGELYNCSTTYSCVKNGSTSNGNINNDPCFVDAADDNYHLNWDSPCIDMGDPSGNYDGQTDIDGEERVVGSYVDMGADEYYLSPADFDEDGYVNFIDYAIFAAAWKSGTGDGRYNNDCDLQDNDLIDYNDLALFCDNWLWAASWTQEAMMMGMGGGMGMQQAVYSQPVSELTEEQTAEAEQWDEEELDMEPDFEAMIEFLDKVWFSGDLKECMTEEEYLAFRKVLESHLE